MRLRMGRGYEMAYEFREVKCPWCDHIFMWHKNGREGLLFHEYRLRATGEFLEDAKCPKCGMNMVVLEHVLKGLDTDDERIVCTHGEC